MIKLQDFAKQQGVTDRQVQRLVKKYEDDLQGHVDRRGQNGTWLDDEACEFLRSRMKQSPIVVLEGSDQVEQIMQLRDKLEQKQDKIEELQDKLLEEKQKNFQLESQVKMLPVTIAEERQKVEAELKQKYQDDLQIYKDHAEAERKELERQLQEERNKTWWQKLRGK